MPNIEGRTKCYACNKKKPEVPSATFLKTATLKKEKSGTFWLFVF
jgi:hypothetical protein